MDDGAGGYSWSMCTFVTRKDVCVCMGLSTGDLYAWGLKGSNSSWDALVLVGSGGASESVYSSSWVVGSGHASDD